MKVIYSREQYTGMVIGGFFGGAILVLLIVSLILYGITKESAPGCCGALLTSAMFLGAGIYSTKKAHRYRTARKKLVSEGNCCDGEVIDFIYKRHGDNKKTYMQVRYFSTLLNKEVVFETPAISMSIREEQGIKCTVYEAYGDEPEPMNKSMVLLNVRDSEDNVINYNKRESDGIIHIVDTLDETTVKSTKLSNMLFLIGVIIFFIVVGYFCLKQ